MKRSLCLIVVLVVVGVVFAPSLWGEICLVDDIEMYHWLMSDVSLDLVKIFLPSTQKAGYYRPLIELSYMIDKYIWHGNTRLMHFDNLVFHLVNTYLVFRITEELLSFLHKSYRYLPLFSSLFFGLHPITTESVAWISGRTDLIAASFVLMSTLNLIQFRISSNSRKLVLVTVFALGGVLAKETALAFLPVAILLLLVPRPTQNEEAHGAKPKFNIVVYSAITATAIISLMFTYNVLPVFVMAVCYMSYLKYKEALLCYANNKMNEHILRYAGFLCGLVMSGFIFYMIRKTVFLSDTNKISETVKLIFGDLNYAVTVFLGATGFYVKKFIFPLPLSFAIREIDPLYQFIGVSVFIGALYLLHQRTVLSQFILGGILLFTPSFLIAFGTIAWTAYAERYIYLSLPFWTIGICCSIGDTFKTPTASRIAATTAIILFTTAGIITFHRSVVWMTNVSLLQDSVQKSPRFRNLREVYMSALISSGDYESAREQYRLGSSLPTLGYDYDLDLIMIRLLLAEGKDTEVENAYEKIIDNTKQKNSHVITLYVSYLTTRFNTEKEVVIRSRISDKLAAYRNILFSIDKDPFHLYYSGKVYIAINRPDKAISYLMRASEAFADDNVYKDISIKMVQRLAGGKAQLLV